VKPEIKDLHIEMARKVKHGKIAIVVLLTALIWVWADLAQDERHPLGKLVTIKVAASADPALWVSFKAEDGALISSVPIVNVELKGPASKFADLRRMLNRGTLDLEFFLVPEQEEMTEPGENPLDVLTFLKQSDRIRRLGLTVESCEPKTVLVQTAKLVKQQVTVQCFDKSGVPQKAEVKPETVDAFVPEDRTLTAKVELTSSEIKHARSSPISKTPYIEMPDGQTVEVSTDVDITMPPAEDVRRDYTVKAPNLWIALSPNLQGKYKVEVTNLHEVIRSFTILATPEAGKVYESQPFQMILCILDVDERDAKTEDELSREVIYYLPEGFVRANEIEVPPPHAKARFKFKLVPPSSESSEGE
jgi:hypothetical protein